MSYFHYHGPLQSNSNLFCGREEELHKLKTLCLDETTAYAMVYGGRQTGKTSLLIKLSSSLPSSVFVCRVDFQSIPGANLAQVYSYLKQRISKGLGQMDSLEVDSPFDLIEYLCNITTQIKQDRFVLIMEELGGLPEETRQHLANVIRSIFTNRFDSLNPSLNKIFIILSGSVELFDMATSEVSTLHNICEHFYLPDLNDKEAIILLTEGFNYLGLDMKLSIDISHMIYSYSDGHPYLTQLIGGTLEESIINDGVVTTDSVLEIIGKIYQDNTLLRYIKKAVLDAGLLPSLKFLLEQQIQFSRLDDDMAKLELLGIAKNKDGFWTSRNRIFESFFAKQLNKDRSVADQNTNPTQAKYNIYIQNSKNISLGDSANASISDCDE